jgi:trans-aconitate 3-methyltransferase
MVLDYHRGPRSLAVDLGTGHGIVARALADAGLTRVLGADPSEGMIAQARAQTLSSAPIEYRQSPAESLPFLTDSSVDLVVAAQAAHWFDYRRLFPELRRVVRPGGSLAFWGYKDPIFPSHPAASVIMQHYCYDPSPHRLGPYWPPGREIVQGKLRAIQPPLEDWEDVKRVEYEPSLDAPGSGEGTMLMSTTMTLAHVQNYLRTASAFHSWQLAHPDQKSRSAGGAGDVMDECFDEIIATDPVWSKSASWADEEVILEWGTAVLLARRR